MAFNFKTILDKILELGHTLTPFLQGTPVGAVVAIGQQVLELIDKSQEVLDEDDAAKLKTLRDELEPLVMAHADATAAKLRGDDPNPLDPG
jgi:hypothetical protein